MEEWFDLDRQGRIKLSLEFESVEASQGIMKVSGEQLLDPNSHLFNFDLNDIYRN